METDRPSATALGGKFNSWVKAGASLPSKLLNNLKDDMAGSYDIDGSLSHPPRLPSVRIHEGPGTMGDMEQQPGPWERSFLPSNVAPLSASTGFVTTKVKEATSQLKEALNKIGSTVSGGSGSHDRGAPHSSTAYTPGYGALGMVLERTGTEGASTSGASPKLDGGAGEGLGSGAGGASSRLAPEELEVEKRKHAKFKQLLLAPVVDIDALRNLSLVGIPHSLRPTCWRLLLGYCPPARARQERTLARKRAEYVEMMPQYYDVPASERSEDEQAALRQVIVDVPRTAPNVPIMHEPVIQKCLERMLYIWGIRHPASGYVQGMNDLVPPFLQVFLDERLNPGDGDAAVTGDAATPAAPSRQIADLTQEELLAMEADCYWCLCKLVEGIQDHYTYSQPGIQRTVFQIQEQSRQWAPHMQAALEREGVDFIQFAWRWVNCLLVREVPFHLSFRLWDTYLAYVYRLDEYLVQVCVAFLYGFEKTIENKPTLDFQELIMMLQRPDTAGWKVADLETMLSLTHVYQTGVENPELGRQLAAALLVGKPQAH